MTDSNKTPGKGTSSDERTDLARSSPRTIVDEWAVHLLADPTLSTADATRLVELVDTALRDALATINASLVAALPDRLPPPTVEILGYDGQ